MAFDWTYRGIHTDVARRLTRDLVASRAAELGLTHAYAIEGVDLVPHRWRHRVVDVIVHVGYGDDLLDPQLPDDVHALVTTAISTLARAAQSPRGRS